MLCEDMHNTALTIWCFLDGKPGHEKQSRGLIQGLQALRPVHVNTIPLSGGLFQRLKQTQHTCAVLARTSRPHLLIGAGHATHVPLLLARTLYGGRSIVLMKPSLPVNCFDFVLIPKHDQPKKHARIIATEGALSPVKSGVKNKQQGIILIGGPDKRVVWNNEQLWRQIKTICSAQPEIHWQLSTSRRSPEDFILAGEKQTNLESIQWQDSPAGWLVNQLAEASQCWVTQDSVSMLYEALSAHCAVGVLELASRKDNKISRNLSRLVAENYVTPFSQWNPKHRLTRSPHPLQEHLRCAKIILAACQELAPKY